MHGVFYFLGNKFVKGRKLRAFVAKFYEKMPKKLIRIRWIRINFLTSWIRIR
jgi:hypothetical protein